MSEHSESTYTVVETTTPDGYGCGTETDDTATAVMGTECTTNLPEIADSAVFTNPPLADIQVNVREGGSGETTGTIECVRDSTTPDARLDAPNGVGHVGDA